MYVAKYTTVPTKMVYIPIAQSVVLAHVTHFRTAYTQTHAPVVQSGLH